jgi:hypothetical protein
MFLKRVKKKWLYVVTSVKRLGLAPGALTVDPSLASLVPLEESTIGNGGLDSEQGIFNNYVEFSRLHRLLTPFFLEW